MKHRRSTRGAAPASDAATCRGRRCSRVWPRRAMWIPCVLSQFASTRLRLGPIRAESGRLEFDLYLNPTSAQFTQAPKHKLSTSPHISSLTSLVSVLFASLPLFRLPCGYETLSHSALTQFTASIHSFFSSLSRILNSGIIIKLSILV